MATNIVRVNLKFNDHIVWGTLMATAVADKFRARIAKHVAGSTFDVWVPDDVYADLMKYWSVHLGQYAIQMNFS